MIFGIAGAVLAALDQSRRTLRIFAITLLTYLGTRLTFAILIILFDFWRGPAPLYFEFYVIPLYAIFAALLLGANGRNHMAITRLAPAASVRSLR